jgi:hypothetical protein
MARPTHGNRGREKAGLGMRRMGDPAHHTWEFVVMVFVTFRIRPSFYSTGWLRFVGGQTRFSGQT